MNEREIQLIIEAINRAEEGLRDVQRANRQAAQTVERTWDRTNRNVERGFRASFRRITDVIRNATRRVHGFHAAIAGAAIVGFGKVIFGAAIRLEQMEAGLRAVTGSAEEASRTMARLQEIAKQPGISLEQAIDASINLRAVKLNAELAERAISAAGNALAVVGRSEELSGVVLGMTQMAANGKVLQEEINQISERIPQFRQAMKDAFGTARSEEIQALGISVETFLEGTIAQLEKLDRVNEGAGTAISNLKNAFFTFTSDLGTRLLPAFTAVVKDLTAALEGASRLMEKLFPTHGPQSIELLTRLNQGGPIAGLGTPGQPIQAGPMSRSQALGLLLGQGGAQVAPAGRRQLQRFLFSLPQRGFTGPQLLARGIARQAAGGQLLTSVMPPEVTRFPGFVPETQRLFPFQTPQATHFFNPLPGAAGAGQLFEQGRSEDIAFEGIQRTRRQAAVEAAIRAGRPGGVPMPTDFPTGALNADVLERSERAARAFSDAQTFAAQRGVDAAMIITRAWNEVAAATQNMRASVIGAFLSMITEILSILDNRGLLGGGGFLGTLGKAFTPLLIGSAVVGGYSAFRNTRRRFADDTDDQLKVLTRTEFVAGSRA